MTTAPSLNKEQLADVLRLWNEGMTGRQLAVKYGKSRNAIIGLVHRHGGENRRTVATTASKRSYIPATPRVKKLPPVIVNKEELPFIGPVDMIADQGCCQYIHGDVTTPGWRMCGHPVRHRKSSWCEVHWQHFVRNPVQPPLRNYNRGDVTVVKYDGRSHNGNRNMFSKVNSKTEQMLAVTEGDPQSFRELIRS